MPDALPIATVPVYLAYSILDCTINYFLPAVGCVYRLLFFFCYCVCPVTFFSTMELLIDVKFCTMVNRSLPCILLHSVNFNCLWEGAAIGAIFNHVLQWHTQEVELKSLILHFSSISRTLITDISYKAECMAVKLIILIVVCLLNHPVLYSPGLATGGFLRTWQRRLPSFPPLAACR